MATLRTISQSGKEANWKKDKQVKLSSLEDFHFFTFDDLDFMDRDKKIIASFENFRTDDVIQIDDIISISRDDDNDFQPGTGNRIRVYYETVGSDWRTQFNPIITEAVIESEELHVSIWKEGDYNSVFPGYNPDTLKKIEYPIYSINTQEVTTISKIIGDSTGSETVYTSGSDEVQFVGTQGNPREEWDAAQAYGRTLYLEPDEPNFIPAGTYLTGIVSESELLQVYTMSEDAIGHGGMQTEITDNNWVTKHYFVLKNHLEDEGGIEWKDDFDIIVPASYRWQVVQESPYDEDITINDARFLNIDPQFRGEE